MMVSSKIACFELKSKIKDHCCSQAWCFTPGISVLGRIRQEGCEFKASSSLCHKTLSQNPKKDKRRREREERKGKEEGRKGDGMTTRSKC